MSVQDIVEAYETRLRERWTPDGERKFQFSPLPDGLKASIEANLEGWYLDPGGNKRFYKDDPPPREHWWKIPFTNTREICGND